MKVELESVAKFPEEAQAWKVVDVTAEGGEKIAGFGVWGFSERVCSLFFLFGERAACEN